jgi:hypothetical protein
MNGQIMVCLGIAVLAGSFDAKAQSPAQTTFPTPQAAASALVKAAQSETPDSLVPILGATMIDALRTGDPARNKLERQLFLAGAKKRTKVEPDPDDSKRMIVYVGEVEWPFPAPLVKEGSGWRFDGVAGKEEVADRAIGRHELGAMAACMDFVMAQLDYVAADHDGDGVLEFAQKIISSPGAQDGLYWSNARGEDMSPLGPFFARAAANAESAMARNEKPEPLFGYYYKVLTRQGPNAKGGARDFVADGNLLGGFGLVAWPAEYGKSGIATFVVSQLGEIYEKDLGSDTARVATATAFDPDGTWKRVKLED